MADLVCSGGTCTYGDSTTAPLRRTATPFTGTTASSSTPWTWNTDPAYAGAYAGQKTLQDYYKENQLRCEQMREKLAAYNSLLNQFYGPESTWIRWLIQKRKDAIMKDLSIYEQSSMPKGWLDRYIGGEMELHTGAEGEFMRKRYGELPAIPDWMREYIVPVTTQTEVGQGRGTRTKASTTYTLRPLGAQEKLSAEQQGLLAGWLAWSKAGFPTKFSTENLMGITDIERYWSPYRMESQAMFSKGTNKPRWATAFQR